MKLIEINGTAYNKERIIGVGSPAKDEEENRWYFLVYIDDSIEEFVIGESVEDVMNQRTELILQLTQENVDD